MVSAEDLAMARLSGKCGVLNDAMRCTWGGEEEGAKGMGRGSKLLGGG